VSGTESTATGAPSQQFFLLRRLHSLLGLVPVGVFLLFHLSANSTILAGPEHFQTAVERIRWLEPFLIPIEIAFIFLPLFFHAVLGVKIWLSSRNNVSDYRYGSNVRYVLQRATGLVTFAFVLFHVWQLHWLGAPFGGGHFELASESGVPMAAVSTAMQLQGAWWIAPVYALGVICSVFHLANGIWSSLITWGITVKPSTQRAAGYVCGAFGVVLGCVGLGALWGFRTLEIPSPDTSVDPALIQMLEDVE
jgi:succinate dehydrogenase / fumarate reductase cytochrome b subunit